MGIRCSGGARAGLDSPSIVPSETSLDYSKIRLLLNYSLNISLVARIVVVFENQHLK